MRASKIIPCIKHPQFWPCNEKALTCYVSLCYLSLCLCHPCPYPLLPAFHFASISKLTCPFVLHEHNFSCSIHMVRLQHTRTNYWSQKFLDPVRLNNHGSLTRSRLRVTVGYGSSSRATVTPVTRPFPHVSGLVKCLATRDGQCVVAYCTRVCLRKS